MAQLLTEQHAPRLRPAHRPPGPRTEGPPLFHRRIEAPFLRRLPDHARQPARPREGGHAGQDRPVHRVHRPATRPRRHDRAAGSRPAGTVPWARVLSWIVMPVMAGPGRTAAYCGTMGAGG